MTDGRWPAVERGSGPAIVFLPGYPLDHRMWQPQLEALSGEHRVVLLDHPGYGLAVEEAVPSTLAGFADRVHEALRTHFDRSVVVVGHSFGGYVALQLYKDHPEQFAGLVLADTRSEADTEEAKAKRMATVQRLEDPTERLDADAVGRSLVAPATWASAGPVVEFVRAMVRGAKSRAVGPTLRAIAGRPDLTPVLSQVRVPTLVAWGEEDQLIPPAQTRAMVERVAHARGLGIPNAGHLPMLESPDAFNRGVRELIGRIDSK